MRKMRFPVPLVVAILLIGLGTDAAHAAGAKENFDHYCAQCHGMDGKGKGVNATKELPVAPKNLTDATDLGTFTDDQIFNTLTKGGAANDLSPIMPPWGNTLTRGEIRELVKFVRDMCKCVFDPTLKRKKSAPTKLLQ